MLRKSMIALCAAASVMALTPNMALARGGGGGGGGHGGGGGGFGGHAGGFSGGGFGGGGFAARGGNFGGANFAARGVSGGNFSNSFARAPTGNFNAGAVPGNRVAAGNFGHGRFDHGFRHGRRFFVGGAYYDGYWDYPDYAYDDSYYDNGSCYVVQRRVHTSYGWRIRPVQVCG